MMDNLSKVKQDLIAEIGQRVADRVLEPTNAELLTKLIRQAESDNEAISIASLGTTYKRTGRHFDKRLERMSHNIRYLRRNEELSFHTDDSKPTHKLIIGDNYEALQNLLIEYRRRVDVIYIDPPYGKDSMGEFAKTNYENAITRDNRLSMLYPRLILARQLLSDGGVIFCSIDDRNQAYVKCLFDEVFGESNFVDCLHWKKKKQPSFLAKHTAKVMEHILVYAKNWNQLGKLSVETLSDATKKVVNLTNQESVRHFSKGVRVKCGENGVIKKGCYTIKTMSVEYLNDVVYEQGKTIYDSGVHASYPDFLLKDRNGRIHLFEVKSVNVADSSNIDKEEYEAKVRRLKECYRACSRKLPGYLFYLPLLKGDMWQITRFRLGVEDLITEEEFLQSLELNAEG